MSTPEKNLEFIALSISSQARNALSASFVMNAADTFFQHEQIRFRTNVGNTFTYACLYAAEAQAVVEIAEVISNKKDQAQIARTGPGDRFPIPIEIRGKAKLLNHRDMICHPTVAEWRTPQNQAFADAGHKWNALRAGLVWDVLKQINEALRSQRSKVYIDSMPATPEMGELLRAILLSAGIALTDRDTGNVFHKYFELHRHKFVQELEKYPDGIIESQAGALGSANGQVNR